MNNIVSAKDMHIGDLYILDKKSWNVFINTQPWNICSVRLRNHHFIDRMSLQLKDRIEPFVLLNISDMSYGALNNGSWYETRLLLGNKVYCTTFPENQLLFKELKK